MQTVIFEMTTTTLFCVNLGRKRSNLFLQKDKINIINRVLEFWYFEKCNFKKSQFALDHSVWEVRPIIDEKKHKV